MFENINVVEVVLFFLGTAFSVAGFYIKELYGRMNLVERDLNNHRVEAAKNLVPRTEMQALRDDVRGMLSPINAKLESIDNFLRETGKHSR